MQTFSSYNLFFNNSSELFPFKAVSKSTRGYIYLCVFNFSTFIFASIGRRKKNRKRIFKIFTSIFFLRAWNLNKQIESLFLPQSSQEEPIQNFSFYAPSISQNAESSETEEKKTEPCCVVENVGKVNVYTALKRRNFPRAFQG